MSGSAWLKIAGFIMLAFMLASVTSMLLDPGLGRADDESRRTAHPGGFSIVVPRGWKAMISTAEAGRNVEALGLAPEAGIGFQTAIDVKRLPPGVNGDVSRDDTFIDTTFQGQPAQLVTRQKRKSWQWILLFSRDEQGVRSDYEISVNAAFPQDLEHGPLRPFIDSFRPGRARQMLATTSVAPVTKP